MILKEHEIKREQDHGDDRVNTNDVTRVDKPVRMVQTVERMTPGIEIGTYLCGKLAWQKAQVLRKTEAYSTGGAGELGEWSVLCKD